MLDQSTTTTTENDSAAGAAPGAAAESTETSGGTATKRRRPAKKAAASQDTATAAAAKTAKRPAAKATKAAKTAKTAKKQPSDAAASDSPADGNAGVEPAGPAAKKAKATKTAKSAKAAKTAKSAKSEGSAAAKAADTAESAPASAASIAGGLLFKAPEPVAPTQRRARKATSDAGPPQAATGEASSDEASDRGSDRAAASDDGGDAGESGEAQRKRRRRGGRGRRGRTDAAGEGGAAEGADQDGEDRDAAAEPDEHDDGGEDGESSSSRRRRRRRRRAGGEGDGTSPDDPPNTVTRVRERRPRSDEIAGVRGSTRLEAKKQRRREGREAGRRKQVITEAEFLARRESVERVMVVRQTGGRTQIGVLEDGVLVEHYVSRDANASMAGNVYLGRVQNVLPSMEAAFVDIGKGRNAVLYAGEVNWDAAGVSGQAKRIENVLKSGESVLVQVTKDPMGHKGARLTSQISLPGRYLVFVPEGSMTGISRKLPENERNRLKGILKAVLPEGAGVIVRTAAEGASEEELRRDVERLTQQWEEIQAGASGNASAPALLHGEPDLTVRVIRDVFNEDFKGLVVSGQEAWGTVASYVEQVAPDLRDRLSEWTAEDDDAFAHYRIDEQLAKALDRKVWLPSGGSLVIDRTEAMTVVDVNTGKFTGSGGNLEETVTKNNIEAAEEIVRQLRLRDIGGIIVIDFIDMVLESNRELVLRRLLECLGRDRTKHQVAEVTSLGLVQMTRKRVGQGLLEVFSETCEVCHGRGVIIHSEPVEKKSPSEAPNGGRSGSRRGGRKGAEPAPARSGPSAAEIAARAHAAALHNSKSHDHPDDDESQDVAEVPELSDAPELPDALDAPEAVEAPETPETVETDESSEKSEEPESQSEGEAEPDDLLDLSPDAATDVGADAGEEALESAEPVEVQVSAPTSSGRRRRRSASAPAGPPPGTA